MRTAQRVAFVVGSAFGVAMELASLVARDVRRIVIYGLFCAWWLGVWLLVERRR